jgi:beta-lactamase class A
MGTDNYFTAGDAVRFLVRLDAGALLDPPKKAVLYGWLRESPRSGFGGWLGSRLPAGARASMLHKAGWLPPGCCSSTTRYNTLNEIGIVTTPTGVRYAVAILAHGGLDYAGKQVPFVEYASCAIYRSIVGESSAGCR